MGKSPHKVHLIISSRSGVFKGSWVSFYLILFGTSVDRSLQTSDLLNAHHIYSLKKGAVDKMFLWFFLLEKEVKRSTKQTIWFD